MNSFRGKLRGFPGVQWIRLCLPMQGDAGSIPGPGRLYMPWSNRSLWATTAEAPTALKLVLCNVRRRGHEKPAHHNQRKPSTAAKAQCSQRLINLKNISFIYIYLIYKWASLVAQMVKDLPAMRENLCSIPELGRSPGGRHGNPV